MLQSGFSVNFVMLYNVYDMILLVNDAIETGIGSLLMISLDADENMQRWILELYTLSDVIYLHKLYHSTEYSQQLPICYKR
jgi:hypothetical protein